MWTSTVILAGTVVVEGAAFRWWVTDGFAQRLTVRHARLGTRMEQLFGSPHAQARGIGLAMLAGGISVPDVDVIEDIFTVAMSDAAERNS